VKSAKRIAARDADVIAVTTTPAFGSVEELQQALARIGTQTARQALVSRRLKLHKTRWSIHHPGAKPGPEMLDPDTGKPLWVRGKLKYQRLLCNLQRLIEAAPRTTSDSDLRAATHATSAVLSEDPRLPATAVPPTYQPVTLAMKANNLAAAAAKMDKIVRTNDIGSVKSPQSSDDSADEGVIGGDEEEA